jgi:hypothetical protein
MKYFSTVSTIILLLYLGIGDASATDCKCQCLARDGSVFGNPPGPKTPELCAAVCSSLIIDGKPPVSGGTKPAGTDPPAH